MQVSSPVPALSILYLSIESTMEDLKEKTSDLADHIEDLADSFYKLTIVNVTQKATEIASGAIAMIALSLFSILILSFLGIALSWWLGDLLENRALGFVLGSAFFLLLLVIFLALRKKVIFPYIRNLIIRKVYD